jgi:hypothetical protein
MRNSDSWIKSHPPSLPQRETLASDSFLRLYAPAKLFLPFAAACFFRRHTPDLRWLRPLYCTRRLADIDNSNACAADDVSTDSSEQAPLLALSAQQRAAV